MLDKPKKPKSVSVQDRVNVTRVDELQQRYDLGNISLIEFLTNLINKINSVLDITDKIKALVDFTASKITTTDLTATNSTLTNITSDTANITTLNVSSKKIETGIADKPVTLASGFTVATGAEHSLKYSSFLGMCVYSFGLTGTIPATTHTLTATMPVGYRPSKTIYAGGTGGSTGSLQIRLEATGEVYIWSATATTAPRGQITWFI